MAGLVASPAGAPAGAPRGPDGPNELRIDDLAHRSGIPSGTIRFYQREGLIPPPERRGRIAYYSEAHLRRLERVRALQARGLPLALVGDLLAREDRGQDISAWLALDSAVFGSRDGGDAVPQDGLAALGLGAGDLAALERAGLLRTRADGQLEVTPGMVELMGELVEAGVPGPAIRAGAELVAHRLAGVAEAMAAVGWEIFAADRERLAHEDGGTAEAVLARFEALRAVAQRVVAGLFPRLLDQAIRARSTPFALETLERRRRGEGDGPAHQGEGRP